MSGRTNAILAIFVSLLPLPGLRLLDHFNRNCGDGLCGFFSGLLVLGVLAAATFFFMTASVRQKETPAFLRLIPIALWMLALVPLFL